MSFTPAIGSTAPGFNLPAADGQPYGLTDLADAKFLVAFSACDLA